MILPFPQPPMPSLAPSSTTPKLSLTPDEHHRLEHLVERFLLLMQQRPAAAALAASIMDVILSAFEQ